MLLVSLLVAQLLAVAAPAFSAEVDSAPTRRAVPPISSPPTKPDESPALRSFSPSPVVTGADPRPGDAPPPPAPAAPPAVAEAKPGRAAPPPTPTTVPVVRRPGEEILERRTQRSKTFATAEADKFKTQVFNAGVHVKDPSSKAWVDLDNTLVDGAPGRVRNTAGIVKVDLAKNNDGRSLARVELDADHSVGFSLQGTRPGAGRTDGNTVVYSGVLPHVDIELSVQPAGLKEDIVLASPAAPDRLVYELALQNLSASLNESGDVVYVDAGGTQRAVSPHGFMTDATWSPASLTAGRSEAVTYELSEVSGKTLLKVVLDREWLDDPSRRFPVRVDPQLFVSTDLEDDTHIWRDADGNPATSYVGAADRAYEQIIQTGTPDTYNLGESYLHFQVAQLDGKVIDAANMRLRADYSLTCDPRGLGVYRIGQGWGGHSLTGWPGFDLMRERVAWAAVGCPSEQWWDVTQTVRNWTTNVWEEHGLGLRVDPGSERDTATHEVWRSWNYCGCPNETPRIEIWWSEPNRPPTMANPVSPAQGANFHTLTPTLSVSGASDPDGDVVRYYYRVARYVGPGNGDDAETNVVYNSGWTTAASLVMPAGVLAWNATYTWHVYTHDGVQPGATFPNWVYWFAPVNTAPPVATPISPANGANFHNLTPTLSVSASDPDGDQVHYYYRVARNLGPGNGGDAETDVVYDSGWTTAASLAIPAGVLTWNATYTWHVYTHDTIAQTNPNWVWSFSPVNNAPPTPTLSQPLDQAVTGVTNPTLSAASTDPDGDPVSMAFKVTSDAGLEGTVLESGFGVASWTVPAGALQDGRTYYWSAVARDSIGATSAWAAPRSFSVDLRLGVRPSVPFDTMGPVSVNLANGNVVAGFGSPPVNSVGGTLGVSYSYNSFGSPSIGLSGSYFNDDGNRVFDEPASLTRTDPSVNFDWALGSPNPAIAPDGFLARWTGYLTAPPGAPTQAYTFGTISDDGVRVWVKGILVVDRWFDQGPSAAPIYGGAVTLNGGEQVPITVEYYDGTGPGLLALWQSSSTGASPVDTTWLATEPTALPDGWSMSGDAAGELAYTEARIATNEVILADASGAVSRYTSTGTGGWKPPADEDTVLTNDAERGLLVAHAEDGRTYAFRSDGNLDSVTSALDPARPAAPQYTWGGSPLRLTAITDPVSERAVTLSYHPKEGEPITACPLEGYTLAPGRLCKVDLSAFDSGAQRLHYLNGHLARVVDPGGAITDFGYDTAGRLTQVRDALTNDLIATGGFTDPSADTHKTTIAYYPTTRQGWSVTAPKPDANGARPTHSYDYQPALTRVVVAGIAGYARQVNLDPVGRLAIDKNGAGEETKFTWGDGDRLTKRVDPMGRISTTIYDTAGRPTDSYGPGIASEFTTNNRSTIAPHTSTVYDEAINGLAATYWSNKSLKGPPVGVATGVGDPSGALNRDWGSGAPSSIPAPNADDNWSARFTGEIALPASGTYSFRLSSNDGVRLFIDDTRIVDAWSDHDGLSSVGTFANATAGSRHRIRVEYYDNAGAASIALQWATPTSGGSFSVVPGASLFPRYGLATSAVDADAKKTATEYASPELGLATAAVVDPAGAALRSTTTYEPSTTGYFRRTARSLPKGLATKVTYAYFVRSETAENPCRPEDPHVNQDGALRSSTDADPDGPQAPIVREYRYDGAGRTVATRVLGDATWSCTAYDPRGRPTSSSDSAGSTTTIDYSVAAQVTTTGPDSSGTIHTTVAKVDWLGRALSYTDEAGTTTRTTYDLAGRPTATFRAFAATPEAQLTAVSYDEASRIATLAEYASGTARTSSFAYAGDGALIGVTRPNGVISTSAYDPARAWLSSISNTKAGVELSPWSYLRSKAARVTTEATTGRTRVFGYDGAARLVGVAETGNTTANRTYAYDANSNRCSITQASCDGAWSYDNADRLVSSPYASAHSYDAHGNLISATPTTAAAPVVAETIAYDGSDHATEINDGTTKVAETLAPSGRVLRRVVTLLETGATTEDTTFSYAASGDSPASSWPTASPAAKTTYIGGPGGLLVIDVSGLATYPIANGHGDIVGDTDLAGLFVPNPPTDEFGRGVAPPSRLGWLGSHQRVSTGGTLNLIRMGVRLYDPNLGRFLQVDPVEGGSCNDYDYACGDPINNFDLDGHFCIFSNSDGCIGVDDMIRYGKRGLGQAKRRVTSARKNPAVKVATIVAKRAVKAVKGCRKGAPYGTVAGTPFGPKAAAAGTALGCVGGAVYENLKTPGMPDLG